MHCSWSATWPPGHTSSGSVQSHTHTTFIPTTAADPTCPHYVLRPFSSFVCCAAGQPGGRLAAARAWQQGVAACRPHHDQRAAATLHAAAAATAGSAPLSAGALAEQLPKQHHLLIGCLSRLLCQQQNSLCRRGCTLCCVSVRVWHMCCCVVDCNEEVAMLQIKHTAW